MLKCYAIDNGRLVTTSDFAGPVWLFVDPTSDEKARLTGEFKIDEHSLNSALDPDELPRIELEPDYLTVIFKYPKRFNLRDKFNLGVQSIGMFLFKDRLVLVTRADDQPTLEGRMFTKVDSLPVLLLRIIAKCIEHFFNHLRAINEMANELEPKIMTAMENRYLLLMFAIEKSLVYYVNAIAANSRVIERLRTNARNAGTIGLSPDVAEFVDDLAIENDQCHEQAQIHANVLAGLMDARASIVSNNLNVLIKRLTIISVVFMPLNVLAGVGGMSEFSMMTQGIPWPIAYSLFLCGLGIIGVATYAVIRHFEKFSIKE
jgi:magnesium transporter